MQNNNLSDSDTGTNTTNLAINQSFNNPNNLVASSMNAANNDVENNQHASNDNNSNFVGSMTSSTQNQSQSQTKHTHLSPGCQQPNTQIAHQAENHSQSALLPGEGIPSNYLQHPIVGSSSHGHRSYHRSRYPQSNYQNHIGGHNQHYQQPQRHKYNHSRGPEVNANHVLLLTVINPHYNIHCGLIHQVCSTYGRVNRIVIFRKNGVQAMVEFDSVESARSAKAGLNGCDIYSGCCTLRIEYAKPTRLNVVKNDDDSYDYVTPNLPVNADGSQNSLNHNHIGFDANSNLTGDVIMDNQDAQGDHSSLQQTGSHPRPNHLRRHHDRNTNHKINPGNLKHQSQQNDIQQVNNADNQSHQMGSYQNVNKQETMPFQNGRLASSRSSGHAPYSSGQESAYLSEDPYSRQDDSNPHSTQHYRSRSGGRLDGRRVRPVYAPSGQSIMTGSSRGTVMMVYGLQPDRLNCDLLFNLFCLYGNVAKVKFLRSKQGCAMVQMGDVAALDRCVSSLNRVSMFGTDLQVSYSKQPFLHEVSQPFILPDGSPSFKDFVTSKNNRFNNPDIASKNRILPPSHVLHFFNAPLGITDEELMQSIKEISGHEPVSVKIFSPKVENTKSFSGLAVFKDVIEATETLVLCNHMSIPKSDGPHPYILRLCFSAPNYARSTYVNPNDNLNQDPSSS